LASFRNSAASFFEARALAPLIVAPDKDDTPFIQGLFKLQTAGSWPSGLAAPFQPLRGGEADPSHFGGRLLILAQMAPRSAYLS
jgi:hypothetical protein